MTQDLRTRLLEQEVATFLHRRLHKSQKILVCKSDMDLAIEIVELLTESSDEDD
jgi:hypothetical protein